MKNFDYKLIYRKLNFRNPKIRKLYRIGRGEQGVLLVRPYTNVESGDLLHKKEQEKVR